MDKILIEQAKHLRREYIKNSNDLNKCENRIQDYKLELDKLRNELNEKMDDKSLKEKLILIEKNINIIETLLEPFASRVKELEKDADKLFDNIREKHPGISEEEIQKELIPHLEKIEFK